MQEAQKPGLRALAASLASKGFIPLLYDDRNHCQCCHRVCPPLSKQSIKEADHLTGAEFPAVHAAYE